ncbi:MAG TPA: Ldh family oxidoreductase [Bauldia sp.]|nr:Ldh family oxidoreductase [Bauldia sp.]
MADSGATAGAVGVAASDMLRFGTALLEHGGALPEHARIVMDHLITSSAMGLHSHGVMRVPQYLAEMQSGVINPAARPKAVQTAPARLHMDGERGFGQVVGMLMVEALVPAARAAGMAMINGRHLGHTGRIGAYPEALAEAGLVGVAVCNGAPSGHWVAPFGGRDGRISTNPIATGWPVTGAPPVVADFSTAASPEGVIRVMRDRKAEAPAGYLRDAAGNPTRDPNVLYAVPKGAIQPFGAELGYRGTALALLVEVLTTLLNADRVDDTSRKGTDMTLIAIAPQAGFADLAAGLSDHMRASPPLDPRRPVMMPGDREHATNVPGAPIRVDAPTWAAMSRAGEEAALPLPAATAIG